MLLIFIVMFFMLLVSCTPAYFISARLRKLQESTGSPYSRTVSVISFILISGVIFIAVLAIALYNIRIER